MYQDTDLASINTSKYDYLVHTALHCMLFYIIKVLQHTRLQCKLQKKTAAGKRRT